MLKNEFLNRHLKKIIFLDSITTIYLIKIIPKVNRAPNISLKPEKPFYLSNKI